MKLTEEQVSMLQKYRAANGHTVYSLSQETGIHSQTICNIEAGAGHPRNVRKLVDALGIPERTFYGLED